MRAELSWTLSYRTHRAARSTGGVRGLVGVLSVLVARDQCNYSSIRHRGRDIFARDGRGTF
jgi:hypothetical protein